MMTTYSVCSSEVDAEAASTSAQQKYKDIGPRLEVGNHVTPVGYLRRPIQPHV